MAWLCTLELISTASVSEPQARSVWMYTVASSRHALKYCSTWLHEARAAIACASRSIADTLLARPPCLGLFTA